MFSMLRPVCHQSNTPSLRVETRPHIPTRSLHVPGPSRTFQDDVPFPALTDGFCFNVPVPNARRRFFIHSFISFSSCRRTSDAATETVLTVHCSFPPLYGMTQNTEAAVSKPETTEARLQHLFIAGCCSVRRLL